MESVDRLYANNQTRPEWTYYYSPSVELPHRLALDRFNNLSIDDLLRDHILGVLVGYGACDRDWLIVSGFDRHMIYFREKSEAMKFKLLWK